MTIGIPKGLLYFKYHVFAESFFEELGAEIAVSPDTNRSILDAGVQHCIDEACLPVKIFHGHLAHLKDKCDAVLVPRFLRMEKGKSVCPMFCGLIEMVNACIPGLPRLIDDPIFALNEKSLKKWADKVGSIVTHNVAKRRHAFRVALDRQRDFHFGLSDIGFSHKVALIGHVYNVFDPFVNMNLAKKLRKLGLGTVSAQTVNVDDVDKELRRLFKKPFWYFVNELYGGAVHLAKTKKVDGIVYVSAFSCGVDSVVIELIKSALGEFPILILKVDEHTGEAGFDTRIEAFADMICRGPRRCERRWGGFGVPDDAQRHWGIDKEACD